MFKRTLSTLFLAPPFLAAIWFGFPFFNIFLCVLGIFAVTEVTLITNNQEKATPVICTTVLGFIACTSLISFGEYKIALISFLLGGLIAMLTINRSTKDIIWMEVGYMYITVACIALMEMRELSEIGRIVVIWFFSVVWANDIGAYIVGYKLGFTRITPRISPGKTLEGSCGGIIFAGLISSAFLGTFLIEEGILTLVCCGIILGIGALIGDLLVSYFKRVYGIKDSGTIIPGHGGVLDRGDSILFTAPLTLIALLLYLRATTT